MRNCDIKSPPKHCDNTQKLHPCISLQVEQPVGMHPSPISTKLGKGLWIL